MAPKKVDKVPLGSGMLADAAAKIRARKKRMAEAIGGGFDKHVPPKKKK
jgi:hypothetical protein